jgi:hypothetical protein
MKKRVSILFLIGILSLATFQYVFSFSTGIFGYSGMSSGNSCNNCHHGGITPTVTIEGPQIALPDTTQTYRLIIAGGQEISGGLDVAVTAGLLLSLGPDTQVLNDEITHTAPKSVDQNHEVVFTYAWTAPAITGTVTMFGAGNSVNGNGIPTGDRAGLTSLAIEVMELNEKVYLPTILRD